MICQLAYNNEKTILNSEGTSLLSMRIRALYKAYGFGRDFIRYYRDMCDGSLLCLQDDFIVCCLQGEQTEELEPFLGFSANFVLSEKPLILHEYNEEKGNAYALTTFDEDELEGVTSSIQDGYELLCNRFSSSINSETYHRWYADMSHRVRHGMSRIYTLKGVCSGTAYLNENGSVVITQLATAREYEGKGYARKMLYHIAKAENANSLILWSQNEKSNSFYERIGFEKTGDWYNYEKKK